MNLLLNCFYIKNRNPFWLTKAFVFDKPVISDAAEMGNVHSASFAFYESGFTKGDKAVWHPYFYQGTLLIFSKENFHSRIVSLFAVQGKIGVLKILTEIDRSCSLPI